MTSGRRDGRYPRHEVGAADTARTLLEPAKRAIRSFRAASRGWSRAERVLTETFFAELLELGASVLELVLAPEPEPAEARQEES